MGFDRDIDDMVNLGDGKVYVFKGDRYLRFDIATSAVDADYPKQIEPEWPLPAAFYGGISAATEWPVAHVDDNGGFRVPLNLTDCGVENSLDALGNPRVDPHGVPIHSGGRHFQMEVDFVDTEYPASKSVGEYRQYVRGRGTLNGAIIAHALPDPAGGPPRPMNDRLDAAGNPGTFLEDGLSPKPPAMNVFYGHRLESAPGNADPSDRYGSDPGKDRIREGDYHGVDFPAITWTAGSVFSINGDFLSQAVDSANPPPSPGQVLTSAHWSIDCTGTL